MKWLYYALCEALAAAFFWMPLWWWRVPPVGLTLVVVLCVAKAWTEADTLSVKPLPNRPNVDRWRVLDFLLGNREDGSSGRYAFGSWPGAYNPKGTRWLAICWNCRNWMANFNYLTWPWKNPPLYYREYGNGHSIELGWQQRYGCTVMVCHFW